MASIFEAHRLKKRLQDGKNLACYKLMAQMLIKIRQKSQFTLKRLRLQSFGRRAASKIESVFNTRVLQDAYKAIKIQDAESIKLEKRSVRWVEQQKIKKLKQLFAILKADWSKQNGLNKLGDVFARMHLQMFSKTMLSTWIKYTFRNDQSLFHKSIKAKEKYKLSLKTKSLRVFG